MIPKELERALAMTRHYLWKVEKGFTEGHITNIDIDFDEVMKYMNTIYEIAVAEQAEQNQKRLKREEEERASEED